MIGDYTSMYLIRLIMIGDYTSMYLIRLIMMGDYTSIYLFRLIMMGGSIGCGLLLPVVNYCYLLWFVCSIIVFFIFRQRDFSLFPLPASQKEIVTPILHSSFYILHSSFFILHFSFYILHLRRAPVSGALPPDIFPVFYHIPWQISTKRRIMYIFRKNIPKSFGSSEKSSTFALAFRKTVLLKQINC